ncbi:MAG: hypothetical protein HKN89_05920 [Eudoraea sp.]|nr:hypothetical protein [Eudoraea sp.]
MKKKTLLLSGNGSDLNGTSPNNDFYKLLNAGVFNPQLKKVLNGLSFIIILFILGSCSEDSTESITPDPPVPVSINTTSDLVTVDFVLDYGNNENANDLVVRYSVNNASNLSEVWLFIAPESNFSSLNSTTLAELPSDRYESIDIETSLTDISPSDLLLDTQGNQISNGIKYKLGFATVKGDKISKDMGNIAIEMSDQHYLTGRYKGSWSDEMFPNTPVSIEISSTGSSLSGPGYLNQQFIPQYGGDEDFTISAQIAGEQLQNIVWNELLESYMGGCVGLGTGEGTIVDIVTIRMILEFENCEYNTSNAEIELTRSF